MSGFKFKMCGEIFQTAENLNYLRCYAVSVSELVQTCKQQTMEEQLMVMTLATD
jgi:hypothetical protein